MNFLRLAISGLFCQLICFSHTGAADAAEPSAKKVAIIKADDVRGKHAKWDRFINLSRDRHIKVSLGLIGNSLKAPDPEYLQWLKDWIQSGQVEFWHHGWDHAKWNVGDQKVSEFGGSGYD